MKKDGTGARIETGLTICFCDPRCPRQRRKNENTSGLLVVMLDIARVTEITFEPACAACSASTQPLAFVFQIGVRHLEGINLIAGRRRVDYSVLAGFAVADDQRIKTQCLRSLLT